jgi:hypothetical protein
MTSRRQTATAAGSTVGLARSSTSGARTLCEDRRIVLKVLYWVAVVAISLALVVALILFLESRDESSIDAGVILLDAL